MLKMPNRSAITMILSVLAFSLGNKKRQRGLCHGAHFLALVFLVTLAADAHALGTATPGDIPGALILDAHVAADYVNNITVGPAGNPPFTPGSEVFKLQTTQPFVAIRSYYTPNEAGKSGQAGGWISPIAETRGLGRAALLDKLALPINPDGTRNNTFALVLVPSGVKLWSGPAGAITHSITAPVGSHWGNGGGIQYYVGRNAGDVAGFQVPLKHYVLAAPIGETDLLAYGPRLSGNAQRVGQNLDGLRVQAYSDLDRVLTALDMINLSTTADDPTLPQAIRQLGAERHGALGLAGLHQSRSVMDQLSAISSGFTPDVHRAASITGTNATTWVHFQGAHARQASETERMGFSLKTNLLLAGTEAKYADHWKLGVAAGYLSSDLEWTEGAAGNGDLKSGYVASYASYEVGTLRANGQVFLGYSRIETWRNISIPDAGLWPGYSFALNRTASGSSNAVSSGARFELAHLGAMGAVKFAPFVGLEYQRFARDQFTETGADSLNLQVDAKNLDETRWRLGISSEVALGRSNTMDWSLLGRFVTAPRIGGSAESLSAGFVAQNSAFSETTWGTPKTIKQAGFGFFGRGQNSDFAVNYNYERNSGFAASRFVLSANLRF